MADTASGFEPVFLPPELAPTRSFSVTLGRAYNLCPRAAFLYAKYRREMAPKAELLVGSVCHRVYELATKTAVEEGESTPPPELVKAIVNEVLADPGYWCPVEYHDYIRESAYRWASETVIDPETLIAVETLFEVDLGPLVLRAKIDRAELHDGGKRLVVKDYKSTRNLYSQEDIGRKRNDGTIAAKDYQLVSYAVACVFGVPIRESVDLVTGERREVREPFSLAEHAQVVDVAYVFPGIEVQGEMAERGATLTILELHEYRDSLVAQAAQIVESRESGDWGAVYGEGHCVECPCQAECPIPAERRRHAGTISSIEDAAEAQEQLAAEKLVHTARDKELVNFVKSLPKGHQQLFWGRNHVLEVGYQEVEEIVDREEMWAAMQRAVEHGEPFDRAKHVKVKKSTPIKRRKLSEAELEERRANEQEGTG